jgi:predicted glycoside hydrolase/deacetylase ChbG (UPF0249 family)
MEAGAVTSGSAMVHMLDSRRAAGLAARAPASLGLHLNFTEPYSGSDVPADVRARQARLVRFFTRNGWTMWIYSPGVVADVRACVEDQLGAFELLYDRTPSHINGHHHVHTSLSVLLSGALPSSIPLRRTFTFLPGQKPLPNRLFRTALTSAISRKFAGTSYFVDLDSFVEAARSDAATFAGDGAIEVMTHPEFEEEHRYLMSPVWMELISPFKLGGYDLLQRSR